MVVLGVHAKLCISFPPMLITLLAQVKGTTPLTNISFLYLMVCPYGGPICNQVRTLACTSLCSIHSLTLSQFLPLSHFWEDLSSLPISHKETLLSLSHDHSGSLSLPSSSPTLPSMKPRFANTANHHLGWLTFKFLSFYLSFSLSPYSCLQRLKPKRPIPPLMTVEHNDVTTNGGHWSLSLFGEKKKD